MTDIKATINISNQHDYSAEQLHEELSQLRRYILEQGRRADITDSASELCERLAVLNWLTDDVEFTTTAVSYEKTL